MRIKIQSVTAIIVLALFSAVVLSDPTGPTVDIGTPERGSSDSSNGEVVEAQAGNMTPLTINSSKLSTRWQGYYGNITGTITLDDGSANTMYSWAVTNAQGEIYAVNNTNTPAWAQLECFNFSDDTQNITLSNLEGSLGTISTNDESVNNTFNLSLTNTFTIGESNTIQGSVGCRAVSLYVNNGPDELRFNETILFNNASKDSIVYTTIIEQDETGFSGSTLDFQMIVGDNGDDSVATSYYFFVELS